jgi:hypothetical protein
MKFGQEKGLADSAEFRRRLYAEVGLGIKGLLFRHPGWKATDAPAQALDSEIKRCISELRSINGHLEIAENVPWTKVEGTDVNAYTLLAGKDALLIFLVSHGVNANGSVRVQLPPWASANSLSEVTSIGLITGPEYQQDGGECRFWPTLGYAVCYVLTLKSGMQK